MKKKSNFTSIEPKSPVWLRVFDSLWIGLFWSAMIIVAEKGKWVAARDWGGDIWWVTIIASIAIIFFEVLKYIGAKRLYRLFPWLNEFLNNGKKKQCKRRHLR